MIDPKQIPEAVMEALCNHVGPVMTRADWCAAFAAALNAWPDMVERFFPNDPTRASGIFLPLPNEGADE
jgi:hypothetical protein